MTRSSSPPVGGVGAGDDGELEADSAQKVAMFRMRWSFYIMLCGLVVVALVIVIASLDFEFADQSWLAILLLEIGIALLVSWKNWKGIKAHSGSLCDALHDMFSKGETIKVTEVADSHTTQVFHPRIIEGGVSVEEQNESAGKSIQELYNKLDQVKKSLEREKKKRERGDERLQEERKESQTSDLEIAGVVLVWAGIAVQLVLVLTG